MGERGEPFPGGGLVGAQPEAGEAGADTAVYQVVGGEVRADAQPRPVTEATERGQFLP